MKGLRRCAGTLTYGQATGCRSPFLMAGIGECRFAEMRRRVECTMVRDDDGVKYFSLSDRCADTLAALGLCKVVSANEDSPHL